MACPATDDSSHTFSTPSDRDNWRSSAGTPPRCSGEEAGGELSAYLLCSGVKIGTYLPPIQDRCIDADDLDVMSGMPAEPTFVHKVNRAWTKFVTQKYELGPKLP